MKNAFFIHFIIASFLSLTLYSQHIAAGLEHTLFLCTDSTVNACGNNAFGQLGDSSLQDSYIVKTITQLSNVIEVSAGFYHSMALKNDGTVWAWGHNDWGQLGDGTLIDRSVPVQVLNLTNIVSIKSYAEHSLALKVDGTVWGWGNNGWSQLIDSTGNYRISVPFQIPNLNNVAFICPGIMDSYVIKTDRTIWGWGINDDNFLGLQSPQHMPVQISSVLNARSMTVGSHHILVLKTDSTVWGWGLNNHGQLGIGTVGFEILPIQISGLNNVVKIAAGNINSLALKSNGSVWAFGTNWEGQSGVSSYTSYLTPFQIPNVSGIEDINSHTYHSLAVNADGSVLGWGLNDHGQLGNSISDTLLPLQIQGSCNYVTSLNEKQLLETDAIYYPNPSTDKITGYFQSICTGITSVQISNSMGQVVLNVNVTDHQVELDLKSFENGIYFIKTTNRKGSNVKKIVLQK